MGARMRGSHRFHQSLGARFHPEHPVSFRDGSVFRPILAQGCFHPGLGFFPALRSMFGGMDFATRLMMGQGAPWLTGAG